ncbi:MAG TPA: hypothetical protein VFJ61_02980 [Solirubrobacterales bacterium]|nr:hypothetical protein [Solirubrobacterales bacterium]
MSVVALGLTAVGGLAAEPTIEVTGNSLATYAWTPSTAAIATGSAIAFKNPTANLHGLAWESGPETPGCTGTSSVGKANWSGSCTFGQGGTYKFVCPVHPAQMKGTITVTGPGAPVVSTGSASAVGESEATLNGTVNPSEQETSYFFEYGTSVAYGQKTPEAAAGSGSAPVSKSATVGGLSAATTYHFRLVAKNATGTTFGSDRSFATAGPPSATTDPATAVSDTGATLNGSVNPHGFQTTYFFNYGTTAAYSQKTPASGSGNGMGVSSVSAHLAGLSPETTYHFQLVAESAAGTIAGADRTFTTFPIPLPQPPSTPEIPAPAPAPANPVAPPAVPSTSPDTKITAKPGAKTRDRTPNLRFAAGAPGATFRCSLDGKAFKACRSPYTTPSLNLGRHTFRVAAVTDGLTDPTPASFTFKVIAKKK